MYFFLYIPINIVFFLEKSLIYYYLFFFIFFFTFFINLTNLKLNELAFILLFINKIIYIIKIIYLTFTCLN